MIEVYCEYHNEGKKEDKFLFTKIVVKGHASDNNSSTTNIKVCAGVSACCFGIKNVIDTSQYHLKIGSGTFSCVRETKALTRDKQSIYALNTLVCQLYEIYRYYPNSFKSFELVETKEIKIDGKQIKTTMGFCAFNEKAHY